HGCRSRPAAARRARTPRQRANRPGQPGRTKRDRSENGAPPTEDPIRSVVGGGSVRRSGPLRSGSAARPDGGGALSQDREPSERQALRKARPTGSPETVVEIGRAAVFAPMRRSTCFGSCTGG